MGKQSTVPVTSQAILDAQIADVDVAVGGLAPTKFRGFKETGRAVMVAGTVSVAPVVAVVATDVVLVLDAVQGGVEGARWAELTAGAAGAGDVTIQTAAAGDTSTVVWALFDNTFLT